MCKIEINGGRHLDGSLAVQGAKNSVLPLLAATVLADGECSIMGCPNLSDVNAAIEILECLGCNVRREDNTVTVDSRSITCADIPDALMRKMRSSITFLGAITARCKRAKISSPGGCELGPRPVDLHIKALRELNISVTERGGYTETFAENMRGADIHLDFPSVGATENAMLAAVTARGITTINNAAKEPEIWDLECFLKKMGAKISGAGTGVIRIEGVPRLHGAEHTVIPDRIAAATYLCAAVMTGGKAELTDVTPQHLSAVTAVLKDTGADIKIYKNSMTVKAPYKILPVDTLRTMPYPGFPTDAQAPITALLSVASGTSVIIENIFENRYKHCTQLCKMGADIKTSGRIAVIRGVRELSGSEICAQELRGGAALCIAGTAAHGTTVISGIHHIERGYEDIVLDFKRLGADIKRI